MNINLDFLSKVPLSFGRHAPGDSYCAQEAMAAAAGLPWTDDPTPCGGAALTSAFRAVNDRLGDGERTAFLRPFLMRQGRLAVSGKSAPDEAYTYAAADLACRVFAPLALEKAGLCEQAATLRALRPLVDRDTARAAAAAAYAAAAACAAARVAGHAPTYAVAYAASSAARAADTAADTAADNAFSAAVFAAEAADYAYAAYLDHAEQLLTRLLDVYEAGCWPLPEGWEAKV